MNAAGRTSQQELERKLRQVLYETGVAKPAETDLTIRSPADAVEEYLAANPEGNLPSTMRTHKSRLTQFVSWCEEVADITEFTSLTGPELVAFKHYQIAAGYAPRTVKSHLETVGVFLRFCRSNQYVTAELPYLIPEMEISDEDAARDRVLNRDRARTIIDYLATFRYASREHIVWLFLAETGLRLCTLRALDLQDYIPPTEDDPGYIDLQHRPETGTRLKNGMSSEREITVSADLCVALDDYIAHQRIATMDEYGREPLLTTANGRIAEATIRTYVNKWTAPCIRTNECPHGRVIDECRAADHVGDMDCPSKRSPHDVRRGYITYLRRHGVPKEIISEEVDASVAVINEHYDKTTKSEQRKVRTAALNAMLDIHEGR